MASAPQLDQVTRSQSWEGQSLWMERYARSSALRARVKLEKHWCFRVHMIILKNKHWLELKTSTVETLLSVSLLPLLSPNPQWSSLKLNPYFPCPSLQPFYWSSLFPHWTSEHYYCDCKRSSDSYWHRFFRFYQSSFPQFESELEL